MPSIGACLALGVQAPANHLSALLHRKALVRPQKMRLHSPRPTIGVGVRSHSLGASPVNFCETLRGFELRPSW